MPIPLFLPQLVIMNKATKSIYKSIINLSVKINKTPQKGDIVGIKRLGYEHYGIYTEKNTIIHYTSTKSDISLDNEIMETDFDTFKKGNEKYFIFDIEKFFELKNKNFALNIELNPIKNIIKTIGKLKNRNDFILYSPQETVERARSRLEENEYNLVINNCEHFAFWCKTGISESYQINNILELIQPL